MYLLASKLEPLGMPQQRPQSGFKLKFSFTGLAGVKGRVCILPAMEAKLIFRGQCDPKRNELFLNHRQRVTVGASAQYFVVALPRV